MKYRIARQIHFSMKGSCFDFTYWPTIKWGNLDLFLVYFMISYLRIYHIVTSVSWLKKKCNFQSPLLLVFISLQTWEVNMSEMRWLDPTLQLKIIPLVTFFTANGRTYTLLEHQKLDKMIFQQLQHSICISIHFTLKITQG